MDRGSEGAQATTGAEEITTGTEGERQSHHAPPDFKGMTSVVPDSTKADLQRKPDEGAEATS